jgi:ATP/maltotriose-dependent transcriptional regulator MalT
MTDLSWADNVLTEAVEAAATSGDRRLAAHALVQRGLLRLFTEPEVTPQELFDVADRSIGVFEDLGDESGLARAWRLMAQAHYLARRAGPSAEASERALAYARRTGDRFEQREIVQYLGVALFLGPAPAAQAARTCRRLLEEIAGDPILEVNLLGAIAYLVAIEGRTKEAWELIERCRSMLEEVDERLWLFPIYFGLVALWQSDPAAAERELRPGYERLRTLGERTHFCSAAAVLAQAVYAQGRYEESGEYARVAEEAASPIEVHSQIIARATRAKVLARRGELGPAERLAREAVDFAASSDFLVSHGHALMDLAEVLRLSARSEGAAEALEQAVALHEEKGNALGAKQARALLAELAR